ncbi:hypothetical protein PMIT1313_00234 [Prochlorococcus marinus str. MIT 1313]|nr:hypothetical protein PMIT1313_00234 [Prochlorococcus marinus str. MIT 1313]
MLLGAINAALALTTQVRGLLRCEGRRLSCTVIGDAIWRRPM